VSLLGKRKLVFYLGLESDDHVGSGLGCLLERCSSGAKQSVAEGEEKRWFLLVGCGSGTNGELAHSSFSHNHTKEGDRAAL